MAEQYHALCVENEAGGREVASLHLRDDEELGQIRGLAVYTSPDGAAQQEDLRTYGECVIAPVSYEELLEAMRRSMPSSVFVDGEKLAGSVFLARVKAALDIPLKRPRIIGPGAPDSLSEE